MIDIIEPRRMLSAAVDGRLSVHGFERVRDTRWVRASNPPIRHVVELRALKGASWTPRWGVSLDFVPSVTSTGKITLHRTAKASTIDLGYDPIDYWDPDDQKQFDWRLHPFQDAASARRQAAEIALRVEAEALPWLDDIADLGSLRRAFDQESARRPIRFGFDNYIQYRLAFAFTLARTNEAARARAELDRWMNDVAPPNTPKEALASLLDSRGDA